MADPDTLAEAQLRTIKDLTGMSVDNFAQQRSSPLAVRSSWPLAAYALWSAGARDKRST